MEAGWIRFEGQNDADGVRFTILSAATAGDPAFWALHVLAKVGQWVQADMWCRVLEESARMAGNTDPPRVQIRTLTRQSSGVSWNVSTYRPCAKYLLSSRLP